MWGPRGGALEATGRCGPGGGRRPPSLQAEPCGVPLSDPLAVPLGSCAGLGIQGLVSAALLLVHPERKVGGRLPGWAVPLRACARCCLRWGLFPCGMPPGPAPSILLGEYLLDQGEKCLVSQPLLETAGRCVAMSASESRGGLEGAGGGRDPWVLEREQGFRGLRYTLLSADVWLHCRQAALGERK